MPKLRFQWNSVPKLILRAEVRRLVPKLFRAEVTRAEHRLPHQNRDRTGWNAWERNWNCSKVPVPTWIWNWNSFTVQVPELSRSWNVERSGFGTGIVGIVFPMFMLIMIYAGYHEMPQKICERCIYHVRPYAFYFEMPQNRTLSFSAHFSFWN